jgi:hypothetical protein
VEYGSALVLKTDAEQSALAPNFNGEGLKLMGKNERGELSLGVIFVILSNPSPQVSIVEVPSLDIRVSICGPA